MKDEGIKERIAGCYNIKDVKKFINFMTTIKQVRNVCAHSAVIFDFHTPRGINRIPAFEFNNNNRHSLDSAIKVILYILSQISITRRDEMLKAIEELLGKYSENQTLRSIIVSKMGYQF